MPNSSRTRRDTTLLSGWLFADLLLGLMVIFMVAAPGAPPPLPPPTPTPTSTATLTATPPPTSTPEPTVTPAPTLTPTVTPLPTATPTPVPILSLEQSPETFTFPVNVGAFLAGDPAETDRVLRDIQSQMARLNGRRAGFVLTFGNADQVGVATNLSRTFNDLLRRAMPILVDSNAVTRNYIQLTSDAGRQGLIEVEVYVYTQ